MNFRNLVPEKSNLGKFSMIMIPILPNDNHTVAKETSMYNMYFSNYVNEACMAWHEVCCEFISTGPKGATRVNVTFCMHGIAGTLLAKIKHCQTAEAIIL